MARPGGPETLSEEQRKLFMEAMRVPGMTRDLAAIRAGLGVRTVYTWLARGKAKANGKAPADDQYRQFRQEVMAAEAEAEAQSLAAIARAGQAKSVTKTVVKRGGRNGGETTTTTETVLGDWKALAWILERRKPRKYARRDHHTLANDKDSPLVPTVFELDTGGQPIARQRVAAGGTAAVAGAAAPIMADDDEEEG